LIQLNVTLKMEAVRSSETVEQTGHTALCKTPKDDHHLSNTCCENLNI